MPEKAWNLGWFLMPKWEALECQNSNISWYLLQNMSFGRFRNLIENRCRNGSQNDSKIEPWAPKGRHFEILGCLLGCLIFDEFSIGKKSNKNRHLSAKVVQKAKFSEARRNARGQWGTIGGSRTWRFGKEFGMRFSFELVLPHAVFPHEGGGGFN